MTRQQIMKNTRLELRDISFTYPGHSHPVFNQLNFLMDGGRIGLIGDNGSGKTTLFHILVGLLTPDSGNVLFNEKLLKTQNDFHQLRREVGMLFQNADDQLFSPTVLEDLAFGPLNLGVSVEEAKERAVATLKAIGMTGYENRITHRLSGGEKRLIALATILTMKPKILLLDEPTNDLDQASRNRLLDILGELDQSFLVISHDWEFLNKLTNTFYAMEHGKLSRSDQIALHQHQHAHVIGDKPHIHQ
jgi:cobalt/nickel transport system ATP-binding protein